MTHYLDTSAVVPLILPDAHTSKAESWLDQTEPGLFISSFGRVEFAALSRGESAANISFRPKGWAR
jgi:hypothetical protein